MLVVTLAKETTVVIVRGEWLVPVTLANETTVVIVRGVW